MENFGNPKNLKGQILVIVVIVLLLLSIMVIGIVAVVTRDVEQSMSAEEYETSYNQTEANMINLLDEYASVDKSLEGLLTVPGCASHGLAYLCTSQQDNLKTEISIEDTNKVENYEIGKDETFTMILNNYSGNIQISWTNDIALIMTLEYQDAANSPQIIQDIYDQAGFFTESGTGAVDHPLNYTVDIANPKITTINLSNVTGLPALNNKYALRLKVLMNGSNTSTLLSAYGDSTLPKQIRKFEGVTYSSNDKSIRSSAPILISQIPLAGKSPEIFNYLIRSDSEIIK